MNRLLITAAASVVCAGSTLIVMSQPAKADTSTLFYGHIEGFKDATELKANVTFRDIKTGEFLHRDQATLQIDDGRYRAEVDTTGLNPETAYEVEISGYSAEESFTLVDFVELQPATPGSAQTGHLNISGYVLASRIGLGVSPTIARVQINETGSAQGVRSLTESGTAVYGQANALSGLAAGGYFTTKSVGGRAIVGDALSTTGSTVGGLFYNRSQAGVALWGRHINGAGDSIGVFGETASSNGTAVLANNSGSGDRVELAGANGSLFTEGELPKHEYTNGSAASMVPIAYGYVFAGGTLGGSSGNFTVTRVSTGVYEIDIHGVNQTLSSFGIGATPQQADGKDVASTTFGTNGADFNINILNLDANALEDSAFHFIAYLPGGYTPPAPTPQIPAIYKGDTELWAKHDPKGYQNYVRAVQARHAKATRKAYTPTPVDPADRISERPLQE